MFNPLAALPVAMPPAALGWEAEGQAWSPCSVHSPSSELHLPGIHNINLIRKLKSCQKTEPRVQKESVSMTWKPNKRKPNRGNSSNQRPICCYVSYAGHTTERTASRTERAPYLRNPLTAESTTRRRPESPQGEEDWCEGFNDWTNSRGNKKCLQTIV